MPVKPLTFKGDKKPKKRKHRDRDESEKQQVATVADTADFAEDETWTTPDTPTDLSGPTLIVLPTQPSTCLASDAHGNVFASPIENIFEQHAESAEPHDVRQVWIATQVAGTGQISFKASHGGYLSCDSLGVLGARREARGVEEGFVVESVDSADGKLRWRILTTATKHTEGDAGKRYLCAVIEASSTSSMSNDSGSKKKVSISLRGDGSADSDSTHMILKMQARFKPRVQQNKETKAKEKVSRRELEQVVGRRLDEEEVRRLKRAKKEGTYYEEILDVRVKGKHDKFAS